MIGRHFRFWETLFSAATLSFEGIFPFISNDAVGYRWQQKIDGKAVTVCGSFMRQISFTKVESWAWIEPQLFLRLKQLQKSVPVFEISFDLTVDIIEHIPFTLTVTLSSLAQSGALNARDLSNTQLGGIVFLFSTLIAISKGGYHLLVCRSMLLGPICQIHNEQVHLGLQVP